MSHLTPCPRCSRHVRVADETCPFCESALPADIRPPPRAPRGSRSMLAAWGAALALGAACGGAGPRTVYGGPPDDESQHETPVEEPPEEQAPPEEEDTPPVDDVVEPEPQEPEPDAPAYGAPPPPE